MTGEALEGLPCSPSLFCSLVYHGFRLKGTPITEDEGGGTGCPSLEAQPDMDEFWKVHRPKRTPCRSEPPGGFMWNRSCADGHYLDGSDSSILETWKSITRGTS